LNYSEEKIKTDKRLYHAGEDAFLSVLKSIKDPNDVVMIFSHNPGLTDFANSLFSESIMNIPTTGIVAGKINIDSWSEIKLESGEMLFFDFPKKSKSE
jgi:phosphohistidine phosphatase